MNTANVNIVALFVWIVVDNCVSNYMGHWFTIQYVIEIMPPRNTMYR